VCTVICLNPALSGLATPGLSGVTRPHRCRCGETEPVARPTHLAPGCTLAQPVALLRTAGGLLPHPFTPYPRRGRDCSLLRL